MSLHGEPRTAVVTGASSGIGYAVAEALAAEGSVVHGFDLNEPSGAVPWCTHQVDVTDDASIARAVVDVHDESGTVSVLVNCAGIIAKQAIHDLEFSTWDRVQDVNVKGTIRMIRALRDDLMSTGRGRIVNVSSMTANLGLETYAPYSASKAAVSNLTKVFAAELAPHGVTVNAVCPGWVGTPMTIRGLVSHIARVHEIAEDQARERILSYVPQHRFIDPQEVAHAVLSLTHPLAQAISAEELRVDCGLTLTFTPGLHAR